MKKLVSFALAIGVVSCVTVSQPLEESSEEEIMSISDLLVDASGDESEQNYSSISATASTQAMTPTPTRLSNITATSTASVAIAPTTAAASSGKNVSGQANTTTSSSAAATPKATPSTSSQSASSQSASSQTITPTPSSHSSMTVGSSASVTVQPTTPSTTPPPSDKKCGNLSIVLQEKWEEAYANKSSMDYETLKNRMADALEGVFNDSSKYSNVKISDVTFQQNEEGVLVRLKLCLILTKDEAGFIEDVLKKELEDGKLMNTAVVKDSFDFTPLEVQFTDWKAKDGECSKCSEGGGGPIVIERKCEAEPGYSCKGLKNTKESTDCVKYCDSSAVSIKISTIILAVGILLSFSFNIWK